jgi:ribosomal protein L22
MSPEREKDELQGAKPEAKIADEAAEAKAAEGAEQAAEAAEQGEPQPKRRRRRRKAVEPTAEGTPEAAEAKKAGKATAEEAEAEPERESSEDEEEADEDATAPRPTPKAQRPTPTDGMVRVRARARYVRTSARKARLVCDHIRGKTVPEARAILAFTPRAAARDWTKVLESAVANAEANHELIGDELRIAEAYADDGPTLKRYRPRAMGRATRIRKRTSHLTITLAPVGAGAAATKKGRR